MKKKGEPVGPVCAWCGADLGTRAPMSGPQVARTICAECAKHLAKYRQPVLVVSRSWARLYDTLFQLLRDREDIQVILDRRDPARAKHKSARWKGPDRRRDGASMAVQ